MLYYPLKTNHSSGPSDGLPTAFGTDRVDKHAEHKHGKQSP